MAAAVETTNCNPSGTNDDNPSMSGDEPLPKYVAVVHNTPADNIDRHLVVLIISYSLQARNFYWLPYVLMNPQSTACDSNQ